MTSPNTDAGAATLEVSLGLWLDRPPQEVIETARLADRSGYRAVWVGEMTTYDAFALATRIGAELSRAELVIGPLAVTVRDPMMIAMGAASVFDLTGRPVSVALGTSSPVVVQQWHGRSRRGAAVALGESASAMRTLLSGGRGDLAGEVVRTRGYRLRLAPPGGRLIVAAFGDRALRTAVAHADQLVLNLITPALAADLVERCRAFAVELGREPPSVALWVPSAVASDGPADSAVEQLRRGLIAYLAAPG